jgi:hypothetical protein
LSKNKIFTFAEVPINVDTNGIKDSDVVFVPNPISIPVVPTKDDFALKYYNILVSQV